jgi:hypothetical protein
MEVGPGTAPAGRPLRSLRLAPPPKPLGGGWAGLALERFRESGAGWWAGPSPALPHKLRGGGRIRSRVAGPSSASPVALALERFGAVWRERLAAPSPALPHKLRGGGRIRSRVAGPVERVTSPPGGCWGRGRERGRPADAVRCRSKRPLSHFRTLALSHFRTFALPSRTHALTPSRTAGRSSLIHTPSRARSEASAR